MSAQNKRLDIPFDIPSTEKDEKLCIPVWRNGVTGEFTIEPRFNQASAYLILDMLYNEIKVLEYEEASGIFSPADEVSKDFSGLSAVICSELFPMALKVFREKGIRVYKPVGNQLDENLQHFAKGNLILLNNKETLSTACGGACSTCNSTCN